MANAEAKVPFRYVLDSKADPECKPGEIVVQGTEVGGWKIVSRDPSPFAGLSQRRRDKMLLSVLEAQALKGNMEAFRLYFQQRRWVEEMSRGKAPARSTIDHTGTIRVIDDLGSRIPVRLPQIPPSAPVEFQEAEVVFDAAEEAEQGVRDAQMQ